MDLSKLHLDADEQEDLLDYIDDMNDPYAFESYCGNCEKYDNKELCPFYGRVDAKTKWEKIGCENFWD